MYHEQEITQKNDVFMQVYIGIGKIHMTIPMKILENCHRNCHRIETSHFL